MFMRTAVVCSLLFLAAACSSGVTESTADASSGVLSDVDILKEVVQPETVIFLDQKSGEVGTEVFFDARVDLVPDIPALGCDPGEGCFMDKCAENGDCQSSWCVEHLGEGVCTQTCQEECPPGWKCKQVGGTDPDVIFICVSDHANLCKPCEESDDCGSTGGADDVCVDYDVEGSFCGGQCKVDGDCPWGFSCKDVMTVDDIETKQCANDAGVCPCTDKSVVLALWTPCENTNEWGTCDGKRVCMEEGLTGCDAVVPAEEICNGLDDDCDDETDEPPLVEGEYDNLCDDNNACTEDKCKAEDGCENLPTDGAECLDGDPCTMADHCVQDVCVGTPVECKDDNPCTDDGCDDTGGCVFTPNNAPCDDGNPCTVGDQCEETECVGTELPCDCQANEDCAELEDDNVCNGTLVCNTDVLPYKCEVDAATVIECDPPEDSPDAICQEAHCVPETSECQVIPASEGFACDDANACTAGDKCVDGSCTPGIEINCADDNPCTDDSCDAADGCLHTPNEAPCSDGSACTVNDTCADSQCAPGADLDCNDNNACTAADCDPALGCTQEPIDEVCDDGNACTVGDHCEVGVCVFDSVDNCDDGNPCTTDSCDAAQGCVNGNVDGPCSDNDPCTLNDLCVEGQCVSGALMNCDDGNPCTEDTCTNLGVCENNPVEGQCDDGNECTEGDHCAGGLCVHDGLKECDDSEVCTTDICDPVNGCTYTTNENLCTDGSVCTVGDQCVDGLCVPGDAIECDDGNDCTDDACDMEFGCVFILNQAECDDGDICTTGDVCGQGICSGTHCAEQGLFCSKNGCSDKVCSSLAFDGDDDFVVVSHSTALNLDDTSYTVEAWIWIEEYSPLWVNAILSKFAGAGATRLGWVFMVGGQPSGIGPGSLAVGHYFGEGAVPVATAIASPEESVPTLQWVHAAVTFDKDTKTGKVWLNGAAAGEVVAEPVPPTNFDLHIGSMRPAPCPNCYYWDGFIDEVRISSTLRYGEPFEPAVQLTSDDATLALWDFNEGQGGIAHDKSGNGNDGVISGATWSTHSPADGCCVPQCEGKECGDDGCGGSCGECPQPLGWVPISGGSFQMGCSPGVADCGANELPAHNVSVKPFEILSTEVTEHQFALMMNGAEPSCSAKGVNHPVECVTWSQAQEFCETVGGRLPTEAEWEYAARGGTTTNYCCGDDAACVDGIGWYSGNSSNKQQVMTKASNGFGVYDMTGNVWEWTQDCWHGTYNGAPETGMPPWDYDCNGSSRMVRGGAFSQNVSNMSVSYRYLASIDSSAANMGFRCVVSSCGNGACNDSQGEDCSSCPADCSCGQDEVCHDQVCCLPQCEGKECGADGCGGTCGECTNDSPCTIVNCNVQGICQVSNKNNGTPCSQPGICTGKCQGGTCVETGVETCNGLDDDCDGSADEGVACVYKLVGSATNPATGVGVDDQLKVYLNGVKIFTASPFASSDVVTFTATVPFLLKMEGIDAMGGWQAFSPTWIYQPASGKFHKLTDGVNDGIGGRPPTSAPFFTWTGTISTVF